MGAIVSEEIFILSSTSSKVERQLFKYKACKVTYVTMVVYLKSCLSTLLLVLDSMNISSETIAPIVQQYAQMTRHNKEPKLYIPSGGPLLTPFFDTLEKQLCKQKTV
jgi:hypothetical protein